MVEKIFYRVSSLPMEVDGHRTTLIVAYESFLGLIGTVEFRCEDDFASIRRLFVFEPCRGKGVGKALVEDAISRAIDANCRVLGLSVAESNLEAIALYQSLGFEDGGPDPQAVKTHRAFYLNLGTVGPEGEQNRFQGALFGADI